MGIGRACRMLRAIVADLAIRCTKPVAAHATWSLEWVYGCLRLFQAPRVLRLDVLLQEGE